ncbi:MAG: hypothetical protein ACRDHZ_21255 [Ktedonobacteraceae bacterium]
MVDYEKQKKFAALGESLKQRLEERYCQEFLFYQGHNANRFDLHSKRPADPYFDIAFSSEERLEMAVGDGTYESPFRALVNLSHCTIVNRDDENYGWYFDVDAIWSAVERLCDLGRQIYEDAREGKTQVK